MGSLEKHWLLAVSPLVTLALSFQWTYDGVNPIKLVLLAFFSGLSVASLIQKRRYLTLDRNLVVFASLVYAFICSFSLPIFFSKSPFAQQFYGTTGRNIGFLHYLFLAIIALYAASFDVESIHKKFLFSLLPMGLFESAYSICQRLGLDPAPWKNPGGWMLGTFGNPNFVSSFIGLSVISSLYALTQKNHKVNILLLHLLNSAVGISVVFYSHSIQGAILIAFGLFSIITVIAFRKKRIYGITSLSMFALCAVVSLLGVFQQGPLRQILYQDSVSVRGDYWRAGYLMFKSHFFTGVGIDSYGDHYRQFRNLTAANRNGIESYSNSAHNLFLDLASTGGFFLVLSYTLLQVFVLILVIKSIIFLRCMPMELCCLVTFWVAFHLQTLVSINVSGLAVWGWVASGLLVAFYRQKVAEHRNKEFIRPIKNYNPFFSITLALMFSALVSPLLFSQAKLASALQKNQYQEIFAAVEMFPQDGQLVGKLASAYQQLGLSKESLQLAKYAIKVNRRSIAAWEVIYYNTSTTNFDKRRAEMRLLELDPFWKARI